MKYIFGHAFDVWNNARFILNEWYEAVDRALDAFGDEDDE